MKERKKKIDQKVHDKDCLILPEQLYDVYGYVKTYHYPKVETC